MKKVFKSKTICLIFILIVLILTVFSVMIYYNKNLTLQYYITQSKNELKSENIFYLENLGLGNFTCTGLTFSKNSNTFWIADFGATSIDEKRNPRIIEVDHEFKEVIKIIELNDISKDINLQGIDYDDNSDTIWIAVGNAIYNINKDGDILKQVSLQKNQNANGIYFDEAKEEIYILLTSKYLLKYDIDGNLISKTHLDYYNQDHIILFDNSLLLTVGADYNGDNNFVLKIEDGHKSIFKVIDSYAVEGLSIVGNKLYIINDGYYHNAKIKKSYISVYDIGDIF